MLGESSARIVSKRKAWAQVKMEDFFGNEETPPPAIMSPAIIRAQRLLSIHATSPYLHLEE